VPETHSAPPPRIGRLPRRRLGRLSLEGVGEGSEEALA
jgi:hypothetical protein